MAIRNSRSLTFRPNGVTDSVDATNAKTGSMRALANLVPAPGTKKTFEPRPARTWFVNFADANPFNFDTPSQLTGLLIVGNTAYGMVTSRRFPGFDEPFVCDMTTGFFTAVVGVTADNVPASPPATGEWVPPVLAKIGTRVIVTHPGFPGGVTIPGGGANLVGNTYSGLPVLDGLLGFVEVGWDVGGPGIPIGTKVTSVLSVNIIDRTITGNAGSNLFVVSSTIGLAVGQQVNGFGQAAGVAGFISLIAGTTIGGTWTNTIDFIDAPVEFQGAVIGLDHNATITAANVPITFGLAGATARKFGWFDISSGNITKPATLFTNGAILLVKDIIGLQPGMVISGPGIPSGTTLDGIKSNTIVVRAASAPLGGSTSLIVAYGLLKTDAQPFDYPVAGQDVTGPGIASGTVVVGNASILDESPTGALVEVILSKPAVGSGATDPLYTFGGSYILTTSSISTLTGSQILTFTGGTPDAPLWGAGDTGIKVLPSVPLGVSERNGRAWFACGEDGVVFTDSLLPAIRTYTSQALKPGNGLPVTATAGLGQESALTGSINQATIAFQGASGMLIITGDQATADLAMDGLNVATGTLAPLSIAACTLGLAFVSPEGLRVVDFSTHVSSPVGADGEGVTLPFLNVSLPSRMCAAANTDTIRIAMIDSRVPGEPLCEWWYNIAKKVWSGPHTLATSLIQRWAKPQFGTDSFITAASDVPAKLYHSDSYMSGTADLEEDGLPLRWLYRTSLLPDNQNQSMNAVVETMLSVGITGLQSLTVRMLDEYEVEIDRIEISANYQLPLWGAARYGGPRWYAANAVFRQFRLDWTRPVVFKQAFLEVEGDSQFGFQIGDFFMRWQALGYQGPPWPLDPMRLDVTPLYGLQQSLVIGNGAARDTVIGPIIAKPNVFVLGQESSRVGGRDVLGTGEEGISDAEFTLLISGVASMPTSREPLFRVVPFRHVATGHTHASKGIDNLETDVIAAGWAVGFAITDSLGVLPPGTVIASIAADGLSITTSAAASQAVTGDSFTVSGSNLAVSWSAAPDPGTYPGEILATAPGYLPTRLPFLLTVANGLFLFDSHGRILVDDDGLPLFTGSPPPLPAPPLTEAVTLTGFEPVGIPLTQAVTLTGIRQAPLTQAVTLTGVAGASPLTQAVTLTGVAPTRGLPLTQAVTLQGTRPLPLTQPVTLTGSATVNLPLTQAVTILGTPPLPLVRAVTLTGTPQAPLTASVTLTGVPGSSPLTQAVVLTGAQTANLPLTQEVTFTGLDPTIPLFSQDVILTGLPPPPPEPLVQAVTLTGIPAGSIGLTQAVTLTGLAQTITDITPHAVGILGGAGSANSTVAQMSVILSPATPAFAGTWHLGGSDAANTDYLLFNIDSATGVLRVGASDIAGAGPFTMKILAIPTDSAIVPFTQLFTVTIVPPTVPGPIFPILNVPNLINESNVFTVVITSPASANEAASIVVGSVTLDGTWYANGGPPPTNGTVIMEWLLDDVPISGHLTGPPFTFVWNSTTVADGTHVIGARFIDAVVDSANAFPAYALRTAVRMVVVANSGFNNGAQTIPVVGNGINHRLDPPTPDYIHYPGLPPPHNAVHAYPTQFAPPSSSVALRQPANWYIERTSERAYQEYATSPWFYSTKLGGVFVGGYLPQTGITLEDVYDGVTRHNNADGGSCDNMVDPYSTYIPSADGAWLGVDVAGRVFHLAHDGTVTTVVGPKRNRALVPWDYRDLTIDETALAEKVTVVGTASGFGDFGGANDLCYDPRNSNILYVAKTIDHCIIRIDLSVNPPAGTLFAGQDGVAGFVNGPVAIALFNEPSSIIMAPSGIMYVCDYRNSCIRTISADGSTVSTLVGKQPAPTEAQFIADVNTYSPVGAVSFPNAYLFLPFVIRFDSQGNIVVGEIESGAVRLVNLSANTVSRIGAFGGALVPGNRSWMWLTVDKLGTCGPVDDIIVMVSDSIGSANLGWRLSHDGTYSGQFGGSGWYLPEGRGYLAAVGDMGHYPWACEFHDKQARIMTAGFGTTGVSSWRPLNSGDPPYDWANDVGIDKTRYRAGLAIWETGTIPGFPWGARPGFRPLHGSYGGCHLGVLPTFDDLTTLHPTDAALATYIQAGMGGTVPRPEITGNDMRDLIYYIRRSSLAGSWPTSVPPGADDPDRAVPVISNVSATRLTTTSIRVTWTTSKPSLGLAAAGSPLSAATNARYNCWTLESAYTTSHDVTITGLPTTSPTHYAVLAKDQAGNQSHSADFTIVGGGGGTTDFSIVMTPLVPDITADLPLGAVVATITVTPSPTTFGFGAPNFDDGGIFALTGSGGSYSLIVNPLGPGVSGIGDTTPNITLVAT